MKYPIGTRVVDQDNKTVYLVTINSGDGYKTIYFNPDGSSVKNVGLVHLLPDWMKREGRRIVLPTKEILEEYYGA
jgi:hypothetical protein